MLTVISGNICHVKNGQWLYYQLLWCKIINIFHGNEFHGMVIYSCSTRAAQLLEKLKFQFSPQWKILHIFRGKIGFYFAQSLLSHGV